jgi:hypothetical protein
MAERIAIGCASPGNPRKGAPCPNGWGILREQLGELLALRQRGQLAIDDQVGRLDEIGILGELFDRVAAVAKNACLAVDEGDRTEA